MIDQYFITDKYSTDSHIILFTGDTGDLLKTLPCNLVRLIFSSPPYNLGKEYETKIGLKSYLASQKIIIEQMINALSDDGSICWQTGNFVEKGEVYPLDIFYYEIFKELGMHLRNRIIWHFGHGLHASKRFSGRYETILWFTKTDKYVFNLDNVRVAAKYPGKRHFKGPKRGEPSGNPKGKNPSDFWEDIVNKEWEDEIIDIPNVKSNHPEKTIHPCQFPIELVERFILALTNENDWVLDPYVGVGSTIIAAIKNNRKGIGADKESNYINVARKRIMQFYNGNLPYRPIGKPIFQPTGKEKTTKIPIEWVINAEGVKNENR